jgi:hypothetical protein
VAKREQIYLDVDTAPTVYMNSVQIAQSAFDMRLRIGVLEEGNEQKDRHARGGNCVYVTAAR